jgi:hypothetical protein
MTTRTNNEEPPQKESRLLSSEERAIFSQIATKEPPHGPRAQALLAIDEGATQTEAGQQAGLTKGQLRYWLGKFRKDGTAIFPHELLSQAQPEEAQQELLDVEETAGPADEAAPQQKVTPKAKKKPKKKSKKAKKPKKAKKTKKDKKSKKKKSKKKRKK